MKKRNLKNKIIGLIVINILIILLCLNFLFPTSVFSNENNSKIQKVVNKETLRLKKIYEDFIKTDSCFSGEITVKFIIGKTGSIGTLSIVKTNLSNKKFENELLGYIKNWKFPSDKNSKPVEVIYPFVFKADCSNGK
jgi:hypothetical protein